MEAAVLGLTRLAGLVIGLIGISLPGVICEGLASLVAVCGLVFCASTDGRLMGVRIPNILSRKQVNKLVKRQESQDIV